MSSYTNTFTGLTVGVAFPSLTSFTTAVPITLTWPVSYIDSANNLSYNVLVNATAGGVTLTMPPSNQVSSGTASIFYNIGPNTFSIILNDSTTQLITITAGQSVYVLLENNMTTNIVGGTTYYIGSWITTPFGGGFNAVTSVGATSLSNNITIANSPITAAGTFVFNVALDLAQLSGFGGGTGYAARTAANTWSLRQVQGTTNQITSTNPDGVAGNTVLGLATTIAGVSNLTVGNINLVANTISTTNANGNLIISPNGTGQITSTANLNLSTGTNLILTNPANTNSISFTAGNRTTTASFTYPTVDPVNNQVLQCTTFGGGTGVLGWATITTFGGPSTVNAIARYADISGALANSGVIIDNANNITGITSLSLSEIQIGVVAAGTISTLANNLKLAPNGANQVESLNTIAIDNGMQLQFYAPAATPAAGFFTGLKAGALGVSTTFTLPLTDGTISGQAMTTNSAGILNFATIPGRNMICNGDMQVWQRGQGGTASFAINGASNSYTVDRWQFLGGASTNFTISQQIATVSGTYVARIQRNSGNSGTATGIFATSLTRQMCNGSSGNFITISYKARAGTNFSSASNVLSLNVVYGTGNTDVSSITTGFTGSTSLMSGNQIITNNLENYYLTSSVILPVTSTQLSVQFSFAPTGTAGTNDYFDITDVQLEISKIQTPYDRRQFSEILNMCYPFYQKSFYYNIAPAQNVGVATQESRFPAIYPGTLLQIYDFPFPLSMIKFPTMTAFNPSAANAQARDENINADCSSTTLTSTDRLFSITTTGSAGTAAGNLLGIHWTADADLT